MSKDLRKWLKQAGFEQFTDQFMENDIDWDILPELNNEDLKDLGVSKLGDRKKLLAALATLENADLSPGSPNAPLSSYQAPQASRVEAEYRQLTVMFCDLVGSTEMSMRLDPEELRVIIRRYQKACVEAVQSQGGFVARYMGDGVLVYFGYPMANENDAERAVAAGLDVVEACSISEVGSVRVGIATGRVIVGDLLGSGPAEERTVVGETPNLAARLQALASPDTVVVSDITRQLAGGGFHYKDLGQHNLKGYENAITVWQIAGVRNSESRFESSHRAAMNPLVGRNTELMLLADRWLLTLGSEGQAVFVSGEAGIGKSRLIEGLRQEVSGSKHIPLRYQCSSQYSTSAFYPIINQLQRVARFDPSDTPDDKLDKLEALLRRPDIDVVDPDSAKIYAHLLSIPFEHRYGPLTQSPKEAKLLTLEIIVAQVLALAEQNPVLILVEDAQWIDPASEEFIETVIGRMQQSQVLLVVTHRPGWQPTLLGVNNISSLQLNRLGKAYCGAIVRAVAGDFVTEEIVNRIVSRTDGIPLYIEELTKSLVEGGLDIAEADIPATLQASLLARIDRLGAQAKELIQIGAVIGREIPLALLESVTRRPSNVIVEGLRQLVQSELLFQSGSGNNRRYSFKHALVQDSVYDSMLSEVRKAHHLKIAQTLVDEFPQIVETAPELTAHHFTEARSYDEAITYWHRAGKRSAGRSADAESVAQLQRAVHILESVEPNPERMRENLALHIDLTGPLIAIGGYSSAEMEKNTKSALALAEQLGETNRIFPILYGRFVFHLHTGHVDKACTLANDFLDLASRSPEQETIIQGHRLCGFSLLVAGQIEKADTHLQEASGFQSPQQGGSLPFVYGQDIEAAAKVLSAWSRMHCGYPEQAVALFDQALSRARQLNHANTLGVVLFHGGNMFYSMRLHDRVNQCLQELELLNSKHDLTLWQVAESIVRLGQFSINKQHEKVIEQIEPAMKTYTEGLRMNIHTSFMLAQVASANIALNQADEAIAVANRALHISKTTGGHLEDPDIMRILANAIYLKESFSEGAGKAYESALQNARSMKLRWYELRIATDYSKYLAENGNHAQGKELLAPLVASFTEGREMPDMVRAMTILSAEC